MAKRDCRLAGPRSAFLGAVVIAVSSIACARVVTPPDSADGWARPVWDAGFECDSPGGPTCDVPRIDAIALDGPSPPDPLRPTGRGVCAPVVDRTATVRSFPAVEARRPPEGPSPVRLRSPLTQYNVGRRPLLRLINPAENDGAFIDICLDQACTQLVDRIEAAQGDTTSTIDLPYRTLWWRAWGRRSGFRSVEPSATWHFRVRPTTATGPTPGVPRMRDFNGDGYDDLHVTLGDEWREGALFLGSACGLRTDEDPWRMGRLRWPIIAAMGDINGDGFADLISRSQNPPPRHFAILGAATRPTPADELTGPDSTGATGSVYPLGDFDGDGRGEVVSLLATDRYLRITRDTLDAGLSFPLDSGHFGIEGIGDVDGDGYQDAVSTNGGTGWSLAGERTTTYDVIYHGAPPPSTFVGTLRVPLPAAGFALIPCDLGDVDGDGLDDFVVTYVGGLRVFAGGPRNSAPRTIAEYAIPQPDRERGWALWNAVGDFDADGRTDLVVTSIDPDGTSEWRFWRHADLAAGAPPTLGRPPPLARGLSGPPWTMDLNGDGRDDLVLSMLCCCRRGDRVWGDGALRVFIAREAWPPFPQVDFVVPVNSCHVAL